MKHLFLVKKLVFDSALKIAVLHGCESWACNNLKAVIYPIFSAQKHSLSVRGQTCNDLVQAELAYPDGKAFVQEIQISFLRKLMARHEFRREPSSFCFATLQTDKNCCQLIYR